MKLKALSLLSAALCLAISVACEKNSPTVASDLAASTAGQAVTDAATGITVTAPSLTSPAANATFKYSDQPLTLTVKNAVRTSVSVTTTYLFEVATDSAFANKVYSKDGVAEGAGSTSLKIDTLTGPQAKNYFWHARANVGSVVSPFAVARGFSVGAQVVIQAPAVSSPTSGGVVGANGLLTVVNAARTGSVGTMSYRFDVANTSNFSNIVFTTTVTEGAGSTSATMSAALIANATYYWRVIVTDATSGVQSPYSTTTNFQYVPFQMSDATVVGSPTDLGSWPQTATITSVQFNGGGPFPVDFDRRDGPNRWGDTAFGDGSLEYTLGICVNPQGSHWYCSAVVQFWYGRELTASGNASDIGFEWFYDPARWGPITGYQPQPGENVGVFVGSGNLRNTSYNQASCPTFCERSNVQFVSWETGGFNAFTTFQKLLKR
jgi:hypothetical protein